MPTERSTPTAVTGLVLLLASLAATAQTSPDAGSLMRQIEKGQPAPVPQAKRAAPVLEPEMKPMAGMVLTVQRFRFVGNSKIDATRLEAAVASWLRRPVDFAELQRAAAATAAYYREAGWVVRAYLPKQEIDDGVVTIRVVEAVLGEVKTEAGPTVRLSPNAARAIVLAAQPLGQTLSASGIDRALLILQDTPGVAARGDLAAGQSEGETDLVVHLSARPLWAGEVALDNTGSRSTGAERLSATAYANSPLRLGDLATATLIHTEGSDYLRGAWSAPVSPHGVRAGLSHSRLSYQVKGAEFAAMDLHGDSQTTGLDASYPVIRSTTRNLYASANFDFKHYQNLAGSTVTSDYTVRVARLGLSANSFDEWQGGGQNNGSLSLVLGTVDLSGSPNQAADAAAARTDGAFQKIQYTASRHQSLGAQWSVYGALSGQWASKNLESGEKFYLGGAQGVRAYPSSEAGGADGQLLNLELRYRWRQDLNLAAFYDWGQVRVNHDNGFPGAAARNSLSLQGLGLSVGWSAPMGVNLSAAWAHRLGSNPNPTASGKDQDGSLVRNRLWITASLPL